MGFFVWMLYTRFLPFNCKERMICEKWKIRVHVFILGISGFWCIASFDLNWFMGCCVFICWRDVFYRLYSKFSHLGMHVGSFANLVLCGIWGFVELGIIAWNWPHGKTLTDGSDWFYTRCTMYTVGLHGSQITWLYGSMFMYIQKIVHFNAFIHWRLLCINIMQSFCHAYVHCVYVSLTQF